MEAETYVKSESKQQKVGQKARVNLFMLFLQFL